MEKLNEQLKSYDLDTIKDKKITYSLILHQQRERLGISIHEYLVADIIYHFGGLSKSREMGGWCYASKQHLAGCLGLGKKTVDRAITTLLNKDLIEKHPETKYLRTTNKWYNAVMLYRVKLVKR